MTDRDKPPARADRAEEAQDDIPLSRVEYVIVFVLLSAIVVGTWQTFGPSASSRSGSTPARDTAAADTAQQPSGDTDAPSRSADAKAPNGS